MNETGSFLTPFASSAKCYMLSASVRKRGEEKWKWKIIISQPKSTGHTEIKIPSHSSIKTRKIRLETFKVLKIVSEF